jgi:hypothetical protein
LSTVQLRRAVDLHVESPSICEPLISSQTAENTAAWFASCFVATSCSLHGRANKGRRFTWFVEPEQDCLEQKRFGLCEPHESCNSLTEPSLKIYHSHWRRIPCRAGRKVVRGDFALHSSDCVPSTFNHFLKPSSCDACFDSGTQRAGNNTRECAVKLTGWCRFFTTHDESIRQPLLYIRDKRYTELSETRGGRADRNASALTIVLPDGFDVMQPSYQSVARRNRARPRRKIDQKTFWFSRPNALPARLDLRFCAGIIGLPGEAEQGRLSRGGAATSVV